jgi:hypothetical protein
MPKFCSECGYQLPNENMKFCPSCGTPTLPPVMKKQDMKSEQIPYASPKIDRKPISETSRLSGLRIEKYLIPNEIATYATKGSLYVGGEQGLKGYVTNNRVIFYSSKGLLFKSDRLIELQLKEIKLFKIIEEGLVFKSMHLQLDTLRIKGERSDILALYRAIQMAKQGSQ